MAPKTVTVGLWFRKGLRLHDNPALHHIVTALRKNEGEKLQMIPFFIMDSHFLTLSTDRTKSVMRNRAQFLLDSLNDLDRQFLEKYDSNLLVFQGQFMDVMQGIIEKKNPFSLDYIVFEKSTEPYVRECDLKVMKMAQDKGVKMVGFTGHTILDIEETVNAKNFKAPIKMTDIEKLVGDRYAKTVGKSVVIEPPACLPIPTKGNVPIFPSTYTQLRKQYSVPQTLEDLGSNLFGSGSGGTGGEKVQKTPSKSSKSQDIPELYFRGGETEALNRLKKRVIEASKAIAVFEKPKTISTNKSGNPQEPDTTGLSPYLAVGCLSVRMLWHETQKCIDKHPQSSKPPVSMHGQLLFREMFYILSVAIENWDKDTNNAHCKEIDWGNDEAKVKAWEEGQTGYPFIDALMRQLKTTGWMHHLGRHAVSCFLTRGDLWQNWTKGRDVFEKYLLDHDWALNNGNWLWLAGVAPFSMPYFRIYSPIPDAKSSLNAETSTGEFVKFWVPEVKDMPVQFIYQPWKAPLVVQQRAKCIIGKDYPKPIVDHSGARQANLAKFKACLGPNGSSMINMKSQRSQGKSESVAMKRIKTR